MHLTKFCITLKRFASIILLLALVSILPVVETGCSDGKANDDDRPLVVSTIFPSYDFARNVAGKHAEIKLLVDVTDSHSYSPTAMDMVLIEECDVFIYTGGEGDLWAKDFLSTIDCSDKVVINMLDAADHLYEVTEDGHSHGEHEHSHEEEAVYDEHVWLSPTNALSITKAICEALCSIDPSHTEAYQSNTAQYCGELESLDQSFHELVKGATHNSIVVADRFPFRYLCDDYGISYCAALSGCSSASDLTASDYIELAEHLADEDMKVIFTAEYSDGTIAQTVKRESGRENIEIRTLHSCHTLTRGQIDKGATYLSLMKANIKALEQALS